METVNITPTWSALVPYLILVPKQTKDTPERSKALIREELHKLGPEVPELLKKIEARGYPYPARARLGAEEKLKTLAREMDARIAEDGEET